MRAVSAAPSTSPAAMPKYAALKPALDATAPHSALARLAREQGHERHDPRATEHEREGPREHAPQRVGVAREAQAGADRTEHAFGRQYARRVLPLPREQHRGDPEERHRIEHE